MDMLFKIRREICDTLKMMDIFQSRYEGSNDVSFFFGYKIYHDRRCRIKRIDEINEEISYDIYELGDLKFMVDEHKRRYDEAVLGSEMEEVRREIQASEASEESME